VDAKPMGLKQEMKKAVSLNMPTNWIRITHPYEKYD